MKKFKNVFKFLYLHALFFLFSGISVLSKLAGKEEIFSASFFLYLSGVFVILCIYAILWQKILKVFPLVIAYSNKAITIIWGILFGKLIFDESITLGMIFGAVIITAGIVVISFNQPQEKRNSLEPKEVSPVTDKSEGEDA